MTEHTSWNRYVSLQVGSLLITTDQLDIEFEIKGSNSSDANTAAISIFNLSRKTRADIKPDQDVLLQAGYVGDVGIVFSGYVKTTSEVRDQGDVQTKLTVLTKGYATGRNTVIYPADGPIKSIVETAFRDSQIPAQCLDGCEGATLDAEFTSDPSAATDLENCAKLINGNNDETKSKTVKYYVEAAGGYFVNANYVRGSESVLISSETGLIETMPEDPGDGTYNRSLRCGFNHRIGTDSLIELKSLDSGASGMYKVVEYTHKCEGTEFETACKVKTL